MTVNALVVTTKYQAGNSAGEWNLGLLKATPADLSRLGHREVPRMAHVSLWAKRVPHRLWVPPVLAPGFGCGLSSTDAVVCLASRLPEIFEPMLWTNRREGVVHCWSNFWPLINGMDIVGLLCCWRSRADVPLARGIHERDGVSMACWHHPASLAD